MHGDETFGASANSSGHAGYRHCCEGAENRIECIGRPGLRARPRGQTRAFQLSCKDWLTHAVVVGTGSGKTGLLLVLVEEALRSGVPVIMIDVKGDLPNLLLTFPTLSPAEFAPWVDETSLGRSAETGSACESREEAARALALDWTQKLADWNLGPAEVASFRRSIAPRVFTPGMLAAEPLHILSSLERISPLWSTDVEAARESLSASISLLLRLIGRDPDPTRSRDHVVLSVFAERRLRAGQTANVEALLEMSETRPSKRSGPCP